MTSQPGEPKTGTRAGPLLLSVAVATAVVVADQATKAIAVDHLASGPVHLLGPVSLQLEYNTGIAFSIGSGLTLPIVLAVVVLAGLLAWLARGATTKTAAVSLGMVLGGALGNLSDRIFRGHDGAVVDFVHTSFWPTFNVADASIVVGSALFLVSSRRRPPSPRLGRGAS